MKNYFYSYLTNKSCFLPNILHMLLILKFAAFVQNKQLVKNECFFNFFKKPTKILPKLSTFTFLKISLGELTC